MAPYLDEDMLANLVNLSGQPTPSDPYPRNIGNFFTPSASQPTFANINKGLENSVEMDSGVR